MDTFMEQVRVLLEKHPALQIPPKVFEGMDAEVVRHARNKPKNGG